MSNQISELIDALMCLPGVGPKSAERMAYHLLLGKRPKGLRLAECLEKAMKEVSHCQICNNFSVQAECHLCLSKSRHHRQLCIVEMPLDLQAIERSASFSGQYFVLMGHLSPMDGIGPDQLSIDKLVQCCQKYGFEEIIFAINPSVEGEATIHYLREKLASFGARYSMLARGVPMGGELEYLDPSTIGRALQKRSMLAEESC